MTTDRRQAARQARIEAAELAYHRPFDGHFANGDEHKYSSAHYLMSFTKGLRHRAEGVVDDAGDFEALRAAIDKGEISDFNEIDTPKIYKTAAGTITRNATTGGTENKLARRKWEAPTAGLVGDLQGPDAQAVTMPPAPELGSDELTLEMAEVYELALLRDREFNRFEEGADDPDNLLKNAYTRLNNLSYMSDAKDREAFAGRPRTVNSDWTLDAQTVFRGSSPGVDYGPYLSQFMLIGNDDPAGSFELDAGLIAFGAQLIDQKVAPAKRRPMDHPEGDPLPERIDYMTKWEDWLLVQDGGDVRDNKVLFEKDAERRFIASPRDLATYVHDDALYQAYLNACLILLGQGAPLDTGFDELSGSGRFKDGNATGFALYGGPHILTLVTEVATRALKAVRFQKFNNHIRARPEVLAARVDRSGALETRFPALGTRLSSMRTDLEAAKDDDGNDVLSLIKAHNLTMPDQAGEENVLLPMAFQEGSPMHPAYGAGHATVAGACVTVLKAFFDTGAVFVERDDDPHGNISARFRRYQPGDRPVAYRSKDWGKSLDRSEIIMGGAAKQAPLTLEGELNKLAANISIGRNMGGVHYYTDYYDSLRMGEEIAIGMLQEQALCYPTDPFVLSVPTYDGDVVRIGGR